MSDILSPEDLAEEGKKAFQEKRYLEAAQAFQAAEEAYASQGDGLSKAEMSNNRSVALLQAGDAQSALQAVEGSQLTFAQAGDKRRQAMALGNRGAALEKLGRLEEAMVSYEEASELFKQIGEHDLRAPVLRSLSNLQLRTGRQLESLGTMQTGLSEIEQPNLVQRLLKKFIEIPLKRILHI